MKQRNRKPLKPFVIFRCGVVHFVRIHNAIMLILRVAVVYFIFLIVMFILIVVVTIVIQHLYLRAESVPFTPMPDWVSRNDFFRSHCIYMQAFCILHISQNAIRFA